MSCHPVRVLVCVMEPVLLKFEHNITMTIFVNTHLRGPATIGNAFRDKKIIYKGKLQSFLTLLLAKNSSKWMRIRKRGKEKIIKSYKRLQALHNNLGTIQVFGKLDFVLQNLLPYLRCVEIIQKLICLFQNSCIFGLCKMKRLRKRSN